LTVSGDTPTPRSVHEDPAQAAAANGLPGTLTDFPDDVDPYQPAPGRWRRLARLAGAVIVTLLLVIAILVVGPAFWTAHPDESAQLVNGRLVGDTAGYVAEIDRDGRTIAVSRSVFGWRPAIFSVNPDTVITVHGREGALGDLASDMLVRITFEIHGATRMARSIEIGGSRAEPPAAATAPARAAPAEPSAPVRPAASVPQAERPGLPAAAPAPPPSPAPRVVPPAARATPASPPLERVTSPPPAARVTSTPAPSSPPAAGPPVERVAPRPPSARVEAAPEPPRAGASTESDPADGSAAIDWLLNQPGRR
jgi:hypothetical protein